MKRIILPPSDGGDRIVHSYTPFIDRRSNPRNKEETAMDTTGRWILELPTFENGLTFNTQVAQLLLTVVLILAGLLLAYVGLRILKTAVLMAAAGLGGWAGVLLLNRITNPGGLLEMVFFITIAFFGTCGFYFLSVLWNWLMDRLGIHSSPERWLWPAAPLLGGAGIGLVVWMRIYRWMPLALVLAVLFAGTGFLVQRRSRHRRRAFHTYEEIYRMKKEETACAGSKSKGTEVPT